jgi:hypothetical protein
VAIDTQDKRASCLGVAGPGRLALPGPDVAAEDQGDRQHLAFVYRGILAGEAEAEAPAAPDTGPSRWRRRRFNDRGNWNVLRTSAR